MGNRTISSAGTQRSIGSDGTQRVFKGAGGVKLSVALPVVLVNASAPREISTPRTGRTFIST